MGRRQRRGSQGRTRTSGHRVRLLIDEHYTPDIARALRDLGHDALSVHDLPALRGQPDEGILEFAARERRAIVTENVRDFALVTRDAGIGASEHSGLIFTSGRRFPRTRDAMAPMVSSLDKLLRSEPDDDALRNATIWLR